MKQTQNRDYWMLATIFLCGVIGGFVLGNFYSSPGLGDSLPVNVKVSFEGGSDAVLGDPNAPVVMEEYSDFQCPYCERFHSSTFDLIKTNYIDTGKVKFVYKDFPLSGHPQAMIASVAAHCAADQNNYWGMHNALFLNMSLWSGNTAARDVFIKIADKLDLNVKKFTACLDSGEKEASIQQSAMEGRQVGVTGTPGFFVNGQLIKGALPYNDFVKVIDAELAKTQ